MINYDAEVDRDWSSEIQMFDFQGSSIRMVGTADKPEFVGADVVSVLYPDIDPKHRATYLRGVPDEWKGLQKVQTIKGLQKVQTLAEPGLYHLIARSNSPIAIPFQRWVFEEVLPTIRKTGGYDPEIALHQKPLSRDRVIRRLELENRVRTSWVRMKSSEERLLLALSHLRSEELWRDIVDDDGSPHYAKFEDYCKSVLGIEKAQGHQKALAGDVLQTLTGVWRPKSTEALATLNQVPEEEREALLGQLADEGKNPTTANIRAAANLADRHRKRVPDEAEEERDTGKVPATVYLTPDLKQQAEELAAQRQLSFSGFIANLIYQETLKAKSSSEIAQE